MGCKSGTGMSGSMAREKRLAVQLSIRQLAPGDMLGSHESPGRPRLEHADRALPALNLWIYPVLLGSGKKLFADGTIPTALRLVDSATFSTGTVLLTYQRVGKPRYGDMAWDADQAT